MKNSFSLHYDKVSIDRLTKVAKLFLIGLLIFALPSIALAINPDQVPKNKRTDLGLYFTAVEANAQMVEFGNKSLFVDVRDPIEVNFTGMPSVADLNIPFKFADNAKFHLKKKQFDMVTNKSFVKDVDKAIADKGLTKNDVIIVMCRSGPRSAKAANALSKAGYTNVYNLIEGFEGDAIKVGEAKGQRTINGWKNAGLAWDTPKGLDINKMYGKPQAIAGN